MNSIKKHYIKSIMIYITAQMMISILLRGEIQVSAGHIVSAVAILGVASISLHDFFKGKNHRQNMYKLFMGIGAFSYSLRYLVWIYDELIAKQNVISEHAELLFCLPGDIFIMLAGLIILLKFAGKWNELRAIVDIFVFGVFAVYISWTCLIKLYVTELSMIRMDMVFSIVHIVVYIIIIFEYAMLYMHENEYFRSPAKKTGLAGIMLLISGELWNYYRMLYSYIPNITEKLWPVSLFMISIGMMQDNVNLQKTPEPRKSSVGIISSILLAAGFLVAVKLNTNMSIRIMFTATILFRIIIIKYMRAYETNEALISKYADANNMLKAKMYQASNIFCDLENKVRLRTEELKEKNSELFYISNIDFLTGLPNRRSFVEYLENLISQSRSGSKFAILFIDIDRFKSINDWYGHDVGDYILIETSKRLSKSLEDGDMVARLGGDEFVVIIDRIKTEDYVMKLAQRIVADCREPFIFEGKSIFTTISAGVAIYPLNAAERSSLMKCADIALYRSKDEGKNMVSMYDWSMKNKENRKLEIENRLCQALDNEEFYLSYQPQFELSTGKILGIEALAKWRSAGLGEIETKEFLEISEANGMIVNIGKSLMEEAVTAVKRLNLLYDMDLRIAINISQRQFIEPDFTNSLSEIISCHGIKPSWLELEVTEELTMTNEELVLAKLLEISNMGVRVVIDNFGKGYSSFLYLKKYPINTIKIAMELVRGIGDRVDDYKIVKSIISMCHELDIDVMAEGVENGIQQNILKNIGCTSVQGYFPGGLMTIEEIESKFCMNKKIEKNESNSKYENIGFN